jgi:hypothetical protein
MLAKRIGNKKVLKQLKNLYHWQNQCYEENLQVLSIAYTLMKQNKSFNIDYI